MPYIDMDSGTVVNGPIVFVPTWDVFPDDFSDSEAREIGTTYGTLAVPQGVPMHMNLTFSFDRIVNHDGTPAVRLEVWEDGGEMPVATAYGDTPGRAMIALMAVATFDSIFAEEE